MATRHCLPRAGRAGWGWLLWGVVTVGFAVGLAWSARTRLAAVRDLLRLDARWQASVAAGNHPLPERLSLVWREVRLDAARARSATGWLRRAWRSAARHGMTPVLLAAFDPVTGEGVWYGRATRDRRACSAGIGVDGDGRLNNLQIAPEAAQRAVGSVARRETGVSRRFTGACASSWRAPARRSCGSPGGNGAQSPTVAGRWDGRVGLRPWPLPFLLPSGDERSPVALFDRRFRRWLGQTPRHPRIASETRPLGPSMSMRLAAFHLAGCRLENRFISIPRADDDLLVSWGTERLAGAGNPRVGLLVVCARSRLDDSRLDRAWLDVMRHRAGLAVAAGAASPGALSSYEPISVPSLAAGVTRRVSLAAIWLSVALAGAWGLLGLVALFAAWQARRHAARAGGSLAHRLGWHLLAGCGIPCFALLVLADLDHAGGMAGVVRTAEQTLRHESAGLDDRLAHGLVRERRRALAALATRPRSADASATVDWALSTLESEALLSKIHLVSSAGVDLMPSRHGVEAATVWIAAQPREVRLRYLAHLARRGVDLNPFRVGLLTAPDDGSPAVTARRLRLAFAPKARSRPPTRRDQLLSSAIAMVGREVCRQSNETLGLPPFASGAPQASNGLAAMAGGVAGFDPEQLAARLHEHLGRLVRVGTGLNRAIELPVVLRDRAGVAQHLLLVHWKDEDVALRSALDLLREERRRAAGGRFFLAGGGAALSMGTGPMPAGLLTVAAQQRQLGEGRLYAALMPAAFGSTPAAPRRAFARSAASRAFPAGGRAGGGEERSPPPGCDPGSGREPVGGPAWHFVFVQASRTYPHLVLVCTRPVAAAIAPLDRRLARTIAGLAGLALIAVAALVLLHRYLLLPATDLGVAVAALAAPGRLLPPVRGAVGEFAELAAVLGAVHAGLRDLSVAEALQGELLPPVRQEVGSCVITGRTISMEQVGGDYYDWFVAAAPEPEAGSGGSDRRPASSREPAPVMACVGARSGTAGRAEPPREPDRTGDDRCARQLLVVIGDVSGHGLAAALVVAMAHAAGRWLWRQGITMPSPMLNAIGRRLSQYLKRIKFMTAQAVRVDLATGDFEIANAGHPPLLLRHIDGRTTSYMLPAMPLGTLAKPVLKAATGRLEPGESLVLYTDGAVEALTSDGHPVGYERLAALLSSALTDGVEGCIDRFYERLTTLTATRQWGDDVTFIVIHRRQS